jgi:predicted phosphodiesterase
VKILHISDLHLTSPFEHFEQVWLPVAGAVKAERFDAIIISGDLTQAASSSEYVQLERFLMRDVLPLVENHRERVVLVPGNHDVAWNAEVGTQVPLASLDAQTLAPIVRQALREPERCTYRAHIGALGHLELYRVDPDHYPARFRATQEFISRFYGEAPAGNRVFNLTGADNEQWSAHLFPSSRVAIYGFNSASRNDRFWTGATLDARAIAEAQRHADEHAREFTRIAVWHHGLTTDKGRPDSLNLIELSNLYHAGFRVGFHGHTHEDEARLLEDFLGDRFVVVATGSLGAGSAERPDAVGNQFSIVKVYPGQVHSQVFERKGPQYRARPSTRLQLSRPTLERSTVAAKSQQRIWRVETNTGIVKCSLTLDELDAREPVILEMLQEPHGHALGDPTAETPQGPLEVQCQSLANQGQRFELVKPGDIVERLTWSYRISNSVALTRWEHALRSDRNTLAEGEDEVSHLVRFASEQLRLEVHFEGANGRAIAQSARVVVSRRTEKRGEDVWERVPNEAGRCLLTTLPNGHRLDVEAPLVGHRYAIVFCLDELGHVFADGLQPAITDVLRTCRTHRDASEARSRIVQRIRTEANLHLSHDASWLCLLLSEERQRILPALGEFSEPSWNARFPIGEGVAGHAFRFGKPAFWHEGVSGVSSLIYREVTEVGGPFLKRYEWISCFPILALNGCPVGVFSFAGSAPTQPTEQHLDRLAREICRGGTGMETAVQRVWDALNRGFWAAIAQEQTLNERTRDHAKAVLMSRAQA